MNAEQKQRAQKALAELAQSELGEELPAALMMAKVLRELIAEQPAGVPDAAIKRAASEMYRLGYGYHESHAESILLAAAPAVQPAPK